MSLNSSAILGEPRLPLPNLNRHPFPGMRGVRCCVSSVRLYVIWAIIWGVLSAAACGEEAASPPSPPSSSDGGATAPAAETPVSDESKPVDAAPVEDAPVEDAPEEKEGNDGEAPQPPDQSPTASPPVTPPPTPPEEEKKPEPKPAPAEPAKPPAQTSEKEKEVVADEKDADAEQAKAEDTKQAAAGTSPEVDVEEESPREVEENQEPVKEQGPPDQQRQKRVIGATATILEKKSGYLFQARVDTGAKSCSLHVEQLVIEGESPEMADNVGKMASFKVKNVKGETQWIKCKIATYVRVKKDDIFERRYKVPLVLRWKDFEKKVLVTLNDRSQMTYPMLIGRNFLVGEFVVDVTVSSDD